jgi:hypothetical protein
LVACGGSSSSGGAGAAGAAGTSASGGASGAGGGSGGGTASCTTAATRADCELCCQSGDPVGHASAVQVLTQDCGCNTGAPCAMECADDVCKGKAISDACSACITGHGSAAGKACVAQVTMACETDGTCPPIVKCEMACTALP